MSTIFLIANSYALASSVLAMEVSIVDVAKQKRIHKIPTHSLVLFAENNYLIFLGNQIQLQIKVCDKSVKC